VVLGAEGEEGDEGGQGEVLGCYVCFESGLEVGKAGLEEVGGDGLCGGRVGFASGGVFFGVVTRYACLDWGWL
jgi:hypothetical protein